MFPLVRCHCFGEREAPLMLPSFCSCSQWLDNYWHKSLNHLSSRRQNFDILSLLFNTEEKLDREEGWICNAKDPDQK